MTGPAHLAAATRLDAERNAEQQLAPLRQALAQRVPLAAGTPAMAHVVVVASGKGGTGTSTVAQLLALAAAESGARTLLVDADDAFATQHLLLGVQPSHGLADLRGGDVTAESLLVPVAPTLSLLANASDAELGVAERRALWRRVTPLYASWDLVLVDAGARLDGVLTQCALGAGRLVAVTTPDAIALAATHAVVKSATARFPALPVDVLVSRADDVVARARYDHLEAGARRFLDRPLGFAGALPDDATLARAVGAGMSLPDAATGTDVARAAHAVAARLLSDLQSPSSSRSTSSFLS